MDDQTFGRIQKNATMEVRAGLSTFRGQRRVDVREFYGVNPDDPESGKPTRQGVNLPVEKLPELIRALLETARAAVEAGDLSAEEAVFPALADR